MSRKIAFLFSGQGSQYIGMGKELYDNIPECKEIFDKGQEILNFNIKDLIFNGSEEELTKTENNQPAILLTSLACAKALEINGISSDIVAGLSLGEYSALVYSGVLSFEDGVKLIKERGRIMGSSLPKGLGGMAAIVRLNNEQVEELISRASKFGVIEGANYNCPGQVVVSGENSAIEEAIKITSELGGKAVPLKVSGPFHSSLLSDASDEFYKFLKEAKINDSDKVVYSNVLGDVYQKDSDIKLLLKKQIMTSVLFEKTIRDMIGRGVTTFIEIGPGKALRGFVKKIDRKLETYGVENMKSLESTLESLK